MRKMTSKQVQGPTRVPTDWALTRAQVFPPLHDTRLSSALEAQTEVYGVPGHHPVVPLIAWGTWDRSKTFSGFSFFLCKMGVEK